MAKPMQVLQHDQPSPAAYQLAQAHQLGEPMTEYKVGYSRSTTVGIVSGFVLAGVFLVIGIMAYLNPTSSSSDSPTDDTGLLVTMGIFVLLGLACAFYCLFYPSIYRSWRVYVCSNGFISTRGSKIEVFRWDQVEAVWQQTVTRYSYGVKVGTYYKYTVRRRDGVKVTFANQFKNVAELGTTLMQQSTNILLPQVIGAYDIGHTISFDALHVSRQGLSKGGEWLPWQQVQAFDLKQGIITIKKPGQMLNWGSFAFAKLPNPYVLLELVKHARQTAQV